MADETGGRIVVGIDGSAESVEALRWALEEARLRRGSLEVVHAWTFPALAIADYGSTVLPVIDPKDLQKSAETVAREIVGVVVGDDPTVAVTTTVVRGHPAEVLVSASIGAALLVVGSVGHGGFAGMLLGSVSTHVVHHATCPVVIVKPSAKE